MRKVGWIGGLILVSWLTGFSQSTVDFYHKPYRLGRGFGLRTGLNYSLPTVTAYYLNRATPTSILWGIRPKMGAYLGATYFTDLVTKRLNLRLDATLHLKQTNTVNPVNSFHLTSRYYYLSLSPMLGIQLTQHWLLYTGAELNLLLLQRHAWGKGYPLDVGTSLRTQYQFGALSVELSYYRGFLKYDQFDGPTLPGGPTVNDFYNQTLALGVIYYLK